MRSRGYLLTGAVVGTALGALATPIFYEFGSFLPGFTAEGAHDSEAAAKTLVIGAEAAYRNQAMAAPAPEPSSDAVAALGDPADATAPPTSSTTAPPTDAPSGPTSAPDRSGAPSTSVSAPPSGAAKTACASLRADNEAKLHIAAGLRSELNVESPARYQVVVTLVAAQSSDAMTENENRLNGLAAIAEVNRADFQATPDGRYRAPMTDRGLCRALFLRTVVAIEVLDPVAGPPTTAPGVATTSTTAPPPTAGTPRP